MRVPSRSGSPTRLATASAYVVRRERTRRRLLVVGRGLGTRRGDPARLHGGSHHENPPRHRDHAGWHADSGTRRDDGHEPQRDVGRALHARARRKRAAGHRGLARHPLRAAAPANARDGRDCSAGGARRATCLQGQGLRAAPARRRGQGAQVGGQAPARDPDLPGHALAEEPRDDGRDRDGWLGNHMPRARARVLRPPCEAGAVRAGRSPRPARPQAGGVVAFSDDVERLIPPRKPVSRYRSAPWARAIKLLQRRVQARATKTSRAKSSALARRQAGSSDRANPDELCSRPICSARKLWCASDRGVSRGPVSPTLRVEPPATPRREAPTPGVCSSSSAPFERRIR